MRRARSTHSLHAEIPTSSTGDIAFLLIIFFMVTASFAVTKGLALDLPPDDENEHTDGEHSVLIEVYADGKLTVDCRAMQAETIADYLQPKLERNPRKPIVLYTHTDATYQDLVAAYEALSRLSHSGLPKPNIQIPTPDDLADYTRTFGVDPFESHCSRP
ncbi:MAG: biopolymer transporter ExbD [bacterium]|nr:biopolymer transporter ExbD [bacterium]